MKCGKAKEASEDSCMGKKRTFFKGKSPLFHRSRSFGLCGFSPSLELGHKGVRNPWGLMWIYLLRFCVGRGKVVGLDNVGELGVVPMPTPSSRSIPLPIPPPLPFSGMKFAAL
jgi:hypothetical protein